MTRFVVTVLALAAPALGLGQSAQPGQQVPAQQVPAQQASEQQPSEPQPAQAIPGVGSSGAVLPGAVMPGMASLGSTDLGPEPANLTRYGVAAGIGETDNVHLSATNRVSQTIAAANADFDVRRSGSRLDASALGTFTDLDYLESAYSNQILGRFDGFANAKLWSDRLKWFVSDDFGEEQTDPFAAITPANLQRVNVFATGPSLTLRPSDATFVDLSAGYSKITYQRSPFDGHNIIGSAEFGRQLSPLSKLSLVVRASEQRFDNTVVNTDFDRREAFGEYAIQGARSSVNAQLGATQVNSVGSSWKTTPLARLSLTRNVSPFSVLTVAGGREYTDAANSFSTLSTGAAGGIIVAPVNQTTANFLRNYGSAGWRFVRLRTTLGLTGNWERDNYDVQSVFDVTRENLGMNLGRSLTPSLSASLTGSINRDDYFHQGFTDKFGTVGASLVYQPGRRVLIYASYEHSFRRASAIPGLLVGGTGYDENRVFVMIGYRPPSDTDATGESGLGGAAIP